MSDHSFRLRSLQLLLLLILAISIQSLSVAENAEQMIGYFTEDRYVRSSPSSSSQKLENLSAYDVIAVTVYDEKWYAYQLQDGTIGYVSRKGWKPQPEYEACDPWQGWTKRKARITNLPDSKSNRLLELDAETLVTIDGTYGKYLHVSRSNGITGYIAKSNISTDFHFKTIKARTAHYYGDQSVLLYEIPLIDSNVISTIPSDYIFPVSATSGSFYVVEYNGMKGYVSKKAVGSYTKKTRTMVCLQDESGEILMASKVRKDADKIPENSIETAIWHIVASPGMLYLKDDVPIYSTPDCTGEPAATLTGEDLYYSPYTAGGNRVFRYEGKWYAVPGSHAGIEIVQTDKGDEINTAGRIISDGTGFVSSDGKKTTLDTGSTIFLYEQHENLYYAAWKDQAGYVLANRVELITADTLMKHVDLSSASIRQSTFLDTSFVMLERGNSFLTRYNAITGQQIETAFPLGIPYFWGGRNGQAVMERWPLYSTREAWDSSPNFYNKGTIYIAGLDCVGFVKEVYQSSGINVVGNSLGDELGGNGMHKLGCHVYCDEHPMPGDWTEVAATLQVGDLILLRHPNFHVMMYIGTLRQFGYTAEQLPALAEYLDYPLVIHCSGHPRYYQRFDNLIRTTSDKRIAGASPPYGGVQISIVGVPRECAQYSMNVDEDTYYCFDVEGTCMTTSEFRRVNWYVVYRHDESMN